MGCRTCRNRRLRWRFCSQMHSSPTPNRHSMPNCCPTPARAITLSAKSATQSTGLTERISEDQIVNLLAESIRRNELDSLVEKLTPSHPGYLKLRKQLNRYLAISNSGRWYPLPDDLVLKAGDSHRLVPHLRWMLSQYGDLKKGALSWLFKEEKPHRTGRSRTRTLNQHKNEKRQQ